MVSSIIHTDTTLNINWYVASTYRNEHSFVNIKKFPNCQANMIRRYFMEENLNWRNWLFLWFLIISLCNDHANCLSIHLTPAELIISSYFMLIDNNFTWIETASSKEHFFTSME